MLKDWLPVVRTSSIRIQVILIWVMKMVGKAAVAACFIIGSSLASEEDVAWAQY